MSKPCKEGCTCGRHRGKVLDKNDYNNRHQRMRRARGSASKQLCARCEEHAAAHWATVHGEDGSDPWADYVALCVPCHQEYDQNGWQHLMRQGKVNIPGKEFSPEARQKLREGQRRYNERHGWLTCECGAGPFTGKRGLLLHQRASEAHRKNAPGLVCECGAGPFMGKRGLVTHQRSSKVHRGDSSETAEG